MSDPDLVAEGAGRQSAAATTISRRSASSSATSGSEADELLSMDNPIIQELFSGMGFAMPRGPIVIPREFIQEGSPLLNPDTADNPFGAVAEQVFVQQLERRAIAAPQQVLEPLHPQVVPSSSKRAPKPQFVPRPPPYPPPSMAIEEPTVVIQSTPAPSKPLAPLHSAPVRVLSITQSAPGAALAAAEVQVPITAFKGASAMLAQHDAAASASEPPRELQMHRIDFNPAQQLELKLINTLDVPSSSPSITHLSLRDCELSPNFITRMYSVMTCFPSLTRLDISHCYIERATARLLPGVAASLPHLTAFSATDTHMNDSCSCHMRALLIACPRITSLNLGNNNMTTFGEDSMCDALTQVNSPSPGATTRHHLSSRLFVHNISGSGGPFDAPSHQLISLTGRSMSRGLSAVQRGPPVDIVLRHNSLSHAAASEIITSIPCFPLLRRLHILSPDFDACLAVGILLAFRDQPATSSFMWYGGRNFGEGDTDKAAASGEGWLHRGSVLSLSQDKTENDDTWSLVAHAAASNLKSTAPCLVQDLCCNYPSVLFDVAAHCRFISVGYCSLSSTFFNGFIMNQGSLARLRDLILLDCITDAPAELLHQVFHSLTGLPYLFRVICGGALWTLINDVKAVSQLLNTKPPLPPSPLLKVFNVSWLPVSHVLLSKDAVKLPFLSELVSFCAKDWSFPPASQSRSAFEQAAAAVAGCLNLATQQAADCARQDCSQNGVSTKDSHQKIELMMRTAETSLMQALAPARVEIGPAVNSLLIQLCRVSVLCLPNSIPNDPDSTIDNLKGGPSRPFDMRCVPALTPAPSAIARLTNLTDLNLDYNPVCLLGDAATAALVSCLSSLSRMQRLSLCGCSLSVNCFELLHAHAFKSYSGLFDLRLSFNMEIGRSELIRTLPRDIPLLRTLKLASVNMRAEDTAAVITCSMEHCSRMSLLDVTSNGNPPFEVVLKAEEKIKRLRYGVVLELGVPAKFHRVDSQDRHANPHALAVKFDMDHLIDSQSSMRAHIEQVHKIYPSCEALVLDGTKVAHDPFLSKRLMVISAFAPLRNLLASRLFTLVLRNMDIGPGLSHAVAEHLTQLTNLMHFEYYGNYAGTEGLYSICRALPHTPALQHLDLGCNYLNAESVHFVVYAVSNLPRLRSLLLAAPPALTPIEHRASITLGDAGLQVLCKGIAASAVLTSITKLSLEGAGAGVAGIDAIASCISDMRSLVFLNISHNSVTPQCATALAAALGRLDKMVSLNMDGCFDSVHGTQDMCLSVLSCIYAMPLLRSFSCGFHLEEVDMRVMLGHVPYQTTTHLSLGLPLPREYISGRLPAYQNLQSLTWCVASLSEKQQVSFSKSVASLLANGLAVLTLFCDHNCDPAAVASAADIKKYHEVCSFSIKGILAAAHTHKHTIKEINFVRLSLHPPCVSAVLEAPTAVQRCLKFHACNFLYLHEPLLALSKLCVVTGETRSPVIPSTDPVFDTTKGVIVVDMPMPQAQ